MGTSWADWANESMTWIQQSGWLGWFAFVALYTITCVFFLPGSFLTIGAGAIYGFWWGTLLVIISSTMGNLANFFISRHLARGWFVKKLSHTRRFHALENAVGKEGWPIILLSRLSPVMPHSLVSYASGLTAISCTRFTLATLIGYIPISAAYAYAGAIVGSLARTRAGVTENDAVTWSFYGLGLVATIVVTIWSSKAAVRALQEKMPEARD